MFRSKFKVGDTIEFTKVGAELSNGEVQTGERGKIIKVVSYFGLPPWVHFTYWIKLSTGKEMGWVNQTSLGRATIRKVSKAKK